MTPLEVMTTARREFAREHKREPTPSELILTLATWIARWAKPEAEPIVKIKTDNPEL